ncbi:MAG: hypothetical protein RL033_5106 [Pseudomonadota bacterium]
MACTVLLFAAHGPAFAVEPVRDVSAWLAVCRVPVGSPPRMAQPAAGTAAAAQSATVQRAPRHAPYGSEPRVERRAPRAARAAADDRYLYLDLQTLRC